MATDGIPHVGRPSPGFGGRKLPRRTADEVRRHVHGQILSGELVAGQRVDLDQIAEELDVSRTPVREALLQLEAEGLIERVPYRGAVVSAVDLRVVEEVLALRLNLESLAARTGVAHLDDEDVETMRRVLEQLEAGGADVSDPSYPFNELNHDFHALLYRKAQSPNLLRFIDILATQADRIRLHYGIGHNRSVHQQHQQILEACVKRDPEEVVAAVRAHIVAVIATFLEIAPGLELTPSSPLWHALAPDELSALLAGVARQDSSAANRPKAAPRSSKVRR